MTSISTLDIFIVIASTLLFLKMEHHFTDLSPYEVNIRQVTAPYFSLGTLVPIQSDGSLNTRAQVGKYEHVNKTSTQGNVFHILPAQLQHPSDLSAVGCSLLR